MHFWQRPSSRNSCAFARSWEGCLTPAWLGDIITTYSEWGFPTGDSSRVMCQKRGYVFMQNVHCHCLIVTEIAIYRRILFKLLSIKLNKILKRGSSVVSSVQTDKELMGTFL
jgi:hypothetical protein